MNRFVLIALAVLAAAIVSCQSSVTETGNPCPGGDCPAATPTGGGGGEDGTSTGDSCDDAKAPLMVFGDKEVGFEFSFPACWVYTAMDSGEGFSTVDLTDRREKPSMAAIEARRMGPVPSLISYVTENNGDCAPVEYDTGRIKGFLCDKTTPGAAGSDWRVYYFLKGDLLVEMGFELFPGGEAGAARMLGSLVLY